MSIPTVINNFNLKYNNTYIQKINILICESTNIDTLCITLAI